VIRKKIAIVEDDVELCEDLAEILQEKNFTVIKCTGGDVIGKMKKAKPDLVILDIIMPGMDGWEISKIMRETPELEKIKIVMLTVKTAEKDKMIGLDIFKADEYITKPFEVDYLLKTIERLLKM